MYVDLLWFDIWKNEQVPVVRCVLNPEGSVSIRSLKDLDIADQAVKRLRTEAIQNLLPPEKKKLLGKEEPLRANDPESGRAFLQNLPYIYSSSMGGLRAKVFYGSDPSHTQAAS